MLETTPPTPPRPTRRRPNYAALVCGRWCLYPPAKRPTHGLSHLLAMAVRVFGGLSKTFTWSHSDFECLRELTSPAFHSDLVMRIYTYPTAHPPPSQLTSWFTCPRRVQPE